MGTRLYQYITLFQVPSHYSFCSTLYFKFTFLRAKSVEIKCSLVVLVTYKQALVIRQSPTESTLSILFIQFAKFLKRKYIMAAYNANMSQQQCYHVTVVVLPSHSSSVTTSQQQCYHVTVVVLPSHSSSVTTSQQQCYHVTVVVLPSHSSSVTKSQQQCYHISVVLCSSNQIFK